MSEIKNDISFSRTQGEIAEKKRIKIELIPRLEKLLVMIIEKEGYQEMADGCNQAIEEVREYFEDVCDD